MQLTLDLPFVGLIFVFLFVFKTNVEKQIFVLNIGGDYMKINKIINVYMNLIYKSNTYHSTVNQRWLANNK